MLLYRWRFIWLAWLGFGWLALVCLGLLCICLCAFFMLLRFFPRVIMIMSSLWQCHCHFIKLMSLHFHWVCRPFIACLFLISSFAQSQHSFKHIWFITPWRFFRIVCNYLFGSYMKCMWTRQTIHQISKTDQKLDRSTLLISHSDFTFAICILLGFLSLLLETKPRALAPCWQLSFLK